MGAAGRRRAPERAPRAVRRATPRTQDDPAPGAAPLSGALLALQRQAGNAAVASALAATPVQRAAGAYTPAPDCPGYEPGEVKTSRSEHGILTSDVDELPSALRIADFAVNSSEVREPVKKHPLVRNWFSAFESNKTLEIDVLGLDDCVGPDAVRSKLREDRARSVLALLGPSAKARVRFAGAAPTEDAGTDNTTKVGRARNRGVLVQFNQTLNQKPTTVTAKPLPRRPTHDCDTKQQDAIKRAHPMAVAMATRSFDALAPIRSNGFDAQVRRNQVETLLRKYFNDDGDRTRIGARSGFERIVRGLGVTGIQAADYQCGGYFCEKTDHAYVIKYLGYRLHLCEHAFSTGDDEIAATIVHEISHLYDFTDDEEYCEGGCPSGLSTSDAIDNADSYGEFAQEVLARGL